VAVLEQVPLYRHPPLSMWNCGAQAAVLLKTTKSWRKVPMYPHLQKMV
jgi:hypothetical protein